MIQQNCNNYTQLCTLNNHLSRVKFSLGVHYSMPSIWVWFRLCPLFKIRLELILIKIPDILRTRCCITSPSSPPSLSSQGTPNRLYLLDRALPPGPEGVQMQWLEHNACCSTIFPVTAHLPRIGSC